MKVKYSQIFNKLKARGIYPLTSTEVKYAEAVRETVLEEIGNPGASQDSALFRKVTELSSKFAKNARHNWKKGHKSNRSWFFQGEMEVNIYFCVSVWISKRHGYCTHRSSIRTFNLDRSKISEVVSVANDFLV